MVSWKDPRVLAGVGSAGALLLALLLLTFCVATGRHRDAPPLAAQHGALQVEMGKEDAKLDPAKPLRCFVSGQFVGELPLVDCAKKNGVAAQALDVGLDQTGQMAAAQTGQTPLVALPTVDAPPVAAEATPAPAQSRTPAAPAPVASAPGGQCLRFTGGEWREAGANIGLQACVHVLYDGRCVRQGDAIYGRFGAQTLRLVPGRVEISGDNKTFRLLTEQSQDCSIP